MLTTKTVTGTYADFLDNPERGYVVISPSVNVVVDNDGNRILSGSIKVRLIDGTFTIDLPCTDDPNLNPRNFNYRVRAVLDQGAVPEVTFYLPMDLPGSLDVRNVQPSSSIDPEFTPILATSFTIGTVETGETSDAIITGEAPNQVLNLVLEKGAKGDIGPAGSVDTVNGKPGPDVVLAAVDVEAEPEGAVAAHSGTSVGVHGIADTSALIIEGDARLSDARAPLAHGHVIADVATLEASLLVLSNSKLNSVNGTLTGYKEATTVDSDTAIGVDFNASNMYNCTGTGAATVTWSNIPAGTAVAIPVTLRIASTITSISWPVGTKFAGGVAPTLSGETWITCVAFNGVVTVGLAWDGVA